MLSAIEREEEQGVVEGGLFEETSFHLSPYHRSTHRSGFWINADTITNVRYQHVFFLHTHGIFGCINPASTFDSCAIYFIGMPGA
jgi:hypothetical protein